MTFEEFIQSVRDRAGLQSIDEAEHATRATLAVLRARLGGPEVTELTAQLPDLLVSGEGVVGDPTAEEQEAEPFDVEEFYRRVVDHQEHAGLTPDDGREQARAVVAVLREQVTDGVMDDVRGRLDRSYGDLFE